MRALLQRCQRGSVTVADEVVGAIGPGLVVLVGTTHGDDEAIGRFLARRVAGYRVFPDESGRANRSVRDAGGAVLVVPQFTLYANTRKGTRPSFTRAQDPALAPAVIAAFVDELRQAGLAVEQGIFGADMAVELVNDGPYTILLEKEPPAAQSL
jgi:D-tyrosyl-tRNA(Tyr) deacylase